MSIFIFHLLGFVLGLFFFSMTLIWQLTMVFGANVCPIFEWQTRCLRSSSYKSRMLVRIISLSLSLQHLLHHPLFFFFLWHRLTIDNYNNGGATTMNDEDPSRNEGATIVVISLLIIKWVHICGLHHPWFYKKNHMQNKNKNW
jgi:hypothetical protein